MELKQSKSLLLRGMQNYWPLIYDFPITARVIVLLYKLLYRNPSKGKQKAANQCIGVCFLPNVKSHSCSKEVTIFFQTAKSIP